MTIVLKFCKFDFDAEDYIRFCNLLLSRGWSFPSGSSFPKFSFEEYEKLVSSRAWRIIRLYWRTKEIKFGGYDIISDYIIEVRP